MNYEKTIFELRGKIPANFENIVMAEFGKYDKNKNGYIEGEELNSLLGDMATFFGFIPDEVINNESMRKSMLNEIDINNDKRINYKEFQTYYIIVYSKEKLLD